MTRPSITPGPWQINNNEIEALAAPHDSKSYFAPICIIDTEWEKSITEANARAIAAVPALLEALEIIDEAFSKFPDYGEPFTRPNGWSVQPMAKVRSALTAAGYQF